MRLNASMASWPGLIATPWQSACTRTALRDDGVYRDRRGRLLRTPFEVILEGDPVTDLVILTRDVPIPLDKQGLKVELDMAATIVRAVLGPRGDAPPATPKQKAIEARNALKLADYIGALAGIARVGLMNLDPTQAAFATLALNNFKSDFVAREGGIVKNAYVMKLGLAAASAIILCIAAYLAIGQWFTSLSPQQNFLWMFIGAAAGAWLSFSIRRPNLSFVDLALLDEDRLRPELRIAFVIVLTAVVGLFFWTGLVRITVGDFNTDFAGTGTRDTALLIGAFCGLAERTLSGAVAKRAEDFVGGLGGSRPPTTT